MSKQEQILDLEPNYELRFKGPFTDVVTAELKLINPSLKRVCFKVKTTAPKRYCVRPNSGIIEKGGKVAVAVMLQPFDYDPNEKNKHKFMVQTTFAPDGPIESQEALWKEAKPEDLMDSKLKCVFELPADNTTQNNLDSVVNNEDVSKMNIKSPAPENVPSPKASNVETDMKRVAEENRALRDNFQKTREENQQLREEGLRLRKVMKDSTTSSTPSPSSATYQTTMVESTAPALPPIVYLIVAFLLGFLIGKWIL